MSLVELLISLLLGSVLSLAIAGVYLESLRNYLAEDEMARLTDNGRYAMGLLRRELMLVGFFAGTSAADSVPATAVSSDCAPDGNWALDVANPLDLVDDFSPSLSGLVLTVAGQSLNCLRPDEIVVDSDIVSVKRTAGNYTLRQGHYTSAGRVKSGQWYLRSEGYGEARSWHYHKSGGLPSSDIGSDIQVDYWEYYARIFYLRKYSESPADEIPTLCVESLSGGGSLGKMKSQCLVEGVEDLQLEFGIDRDSYGTPELFKVSASAPELSHSVVARIFLLMRSVAPVPGYARNRSYFLGRKKVDRSDGYVRRVVSATINLPNLRLNLR